MADDPLISSPARSTPWMATVGDAVVNGNEVLRRDSDVFGHGAGLAGADEGIFRTHGRTAFRAVVAVAAGNQGSHSGPQAYEIGADTVTDSDDVAGKFMTDDLGK